MNEEENIKLIRLLYPETINKDAEFIDFRKVSDFGKDLQTVLPLDTFEFNKNWNHLIAIYSRFRIVYRDYIYSADKVSQQVSDFNVGVLINDINLSYTAFTNLVKLSENKFKPDLVTLNKNI